MCKKYLFVIALFFLLFFSLLCAEVKGTKTLALRKYDFTHYYEYEELTNYLKDMNKAYPQLTELKALCKSQMGRDVWMLIINNPKTGQPEDKPGFMLNQIHAGEVIAAASCSYTIWYLLSNYGKDKNVTKIMDNIVWYIIPRLDVDGAEAYLTEKPAGKDPAPIDNDGDGKFDEDPPEDLDGDGFIVQMRKIDPLGDWKVSKKDPRMMVKRIADESEGTFYKIYTEGIDNDGDGKINEDSFSKGFLSNRNYPGNWQPDITQGGAKRYPMEESTTRAEVDFVADHPNIAIYNQHHCCGRVILRPSATYPDEKFKSKEDLELFKVISARCLELSGWDLATSIYDWRVPPDKPDRKPNQVYRDKDGKLRNAPEGMYPEESGGEVSYGCDECENEYQSDRGYFAWGSALDTMYDLFGIFGLGDEHWREPDYDKDGMATEEEKFKWNDEEMKGKIFINWHSFSHLTLGKVEIGGWRRTKVSPPEGELVQKECEMANSFVIYLASLAARLKIGEMIITDKKGGIYQVDMTVENTGVMPTSTEQAQLLNIVEPVLLEIEPDDNIEILFGENKVKLGQIKGNSKSREITYILRRKDASKKAVLKASVKSQRAGQDVKEIVIQ